MSWFAELAGKAENLLNNLDEQTGAALRNHNVAKPKRSVNDRQEHHSAYQEPPWSQKKRHTPRSQKKVSTGTETKSNNFSPTRNVSPMSNISTRNSASPVRESQEYANRNIKKKAPKKPNTQYSLNHCPRTLVGDIRDSDPEEQCVMQKRRYSLPTDLELLTANDLTYKVQNLEIENAMLKNELNVMNREVSELLNRLWKTEDELSKAQGKLDSCEMRNKQSSLEMEVQNQQLEQLKIKINELTNVEISKYRQYNDSLETEISVLKEKNEEFKEQLKQLTDKGNENNAAQIKLESELRHAQSVIGDLQVNLEKSKEECVRMEKDWEAYKLRVKGMLHTKDNEIKALQQGVYVTQDSKTLVEQLEKLKAEREILSKAVGDVRHECDDMKKYIEQLESKHAGAERVVTALRDALRDERAAKNRAESQLLALGKEFKSLQLETSQTIATLRTELREKENELTNLRVTSSSVRTTDTSALNVADYGTESIDNDRIHYLTETLVQRQSKIDSLLADNNMLRIQLEKLESKYKSELAALRANHNHVVNVQESDRRSRNALSLSGLAIRIGVMMKRYPLFRMFIVIYMIGLHLWVMTVLFTSTPDGHMPLHVKS